MGSSDGLSLDSVRNSLIRQEDTIIFSLIERAKYPLNPMLYKRGTTISGVSSSLLESFVKETEALQAKNNLEWVKGTSNFAISSNSGVVFYRVGWPSLILKLIEAFLFRYENLEEHPFFPDDLPHSLLPSQYGPPVLHPPAASSNINKMIWDMYINQLLPLVASEGHDENYVCIAAHDLNCLQVLSRRIQYGKFVAEVKFKDPPEECTQAIRAKDREALMNLLTFASVEEMVKKRVEKKAKIFGQEVSLSDNDSPRNYKVDSLVVSRLYGEWAMPLTKHVEVEYLLRRLD